MTRHYTTACALLAAMASLLGNVQAARIESAILHVDVLGGGHESMVETMLLNGVEIGPLPTNRVDPYGTNHHKVWVRDQTVELPGPALQALAPENRWTLRFDYKPRRYPMVQDLWLEVKLDNGQTARSTMATWVYWTAPLETETVHYRAGIRRPLSDGVALRLPIERQGKEVKIVPRSARAAVSRMGFPVSGCVFGNQIVKAKQLHLKTPIMQGGEARALVVLADAGPNRQTGIELARALGQRAGLKSLPTRGSADVGEQIRRKWHMLVVGRELDNAEYRRLMWRGYVQRTGDVPGEGGYAITTCHDPWGYGTNTIVVAGSEPQGIAAGAQALLAKVEPSRDIALGHVSERVVNPAVDALLPHPSLTREQAEKLVKEAGDDPSKLRAGVFSGWGPPLRPYPDLYRAAMMRLVEAMERERRQNPRWFERFGTNRLDMTGLSSCLRCWDETEELTEFTDEQRARVDQMFLNLTQDFLRWVGYMQGGFLGRPKDIVRHNHETYPAITLYPIADYFDKYYGLPAAAQWLKIAQTCFEPLATSWKPKEDSQGYNWSAMKHTAAWSLMADDHTFLRSGNWTKTWELIVATTTNLGHQANFGDSNSCLWPLYTPLDLAGTLGFFTRDGRHQWLLSQILPILRERLRGNYYKRSGRILNPGLAPLEPVDLWGVQVCRLSREVFDYYCRNGAFGRQPQVNATYEETFDKIALRTGFDPDEHYLLLDGWSMGYHGHNDGNSICAFTDNGRLWLRDLSSMREWPASKHNVVTFTRDGQDAHPPSFCVLEAATDLPQTAFVRSVAREYHGLHWARNLIWDKNRVVFVVDEMTAAEDGDYLFCARWRTLGSASLAEQTMQVEQAGEQFRLANTNGSRLRLIEDPAPGDLNYYEHADPPGAILAQYSHAKMAKGATQYIENAMWCPDELLAEVQAFHIADCVIAAVGRDYLAIGGLAPSKTHLGELAVVARLFLLGPTRLALTDATLLAWRGRPVLTSNAPIAVEIDVALGRVQFIASGPTQVSLALPGEASRRITLAAGRSSMAIKPSWPGLNDDLRATANAARKQQPRPPDTTVSRNAEVTKLASLARKCTAAAFADVAGDDTLEGIIGDAGGRVSLLDNGGQVLAETECGSPVTFVTSGDLASAGKAEVVVGTADGRVHVLMGDGRRRWTFQLKIPKRTQGGPRVVDAACYDLDGKGRDEILVASLSGSWAILSSDGKPLKEVVQGKSCTAVSASDLDGDGIGEYTVGTEWRGMNVYRFGTNWRRRFRPGRGVKRAAFADLTGDGVKEALYGSEILRALNEFVAAPSGERYDAIMWDYNTGGEVRSLETADLNGDGTSEILVGSEGFYLHVVDASGKQLWARECGGPVTHILSAQTGDRHFVGAATGSGRVCLFDAQGRELAVHTFAAPVLSIAGGSGATPALWAVTEGGELARVVTTQVSRLPSRDKE